MGGTCGDFDDETGSSKEISIHRNAIDATLHYSSGVVVKIKGTFKHAQVKGSLTGTFSADGHHCSLIRSAFTATRG
jgi:hypothetical protein